MVQSGDGGLSHLCFRQHTEWRVFGIPVHTYVGLCRGMSSTEGLPVDLSDAL